MAKTIIEEAKKTFTVRCRKCMALFSYELADLNWLGNKVTCPGCGDECYHDPEKRLCR